MQQIEALLMLFGMAALCFAIFIHQHRTGKAQQVLRMWWTADRATNPGMFLVAQGLWVSLALVCCASAVWILVRP